MKLPVVSLGLWHNFGDTSIYENMKQMCFTSFDNGITHFDLANNYGPAYGSAERNFGKLSGKNFIHTEMKCSSAQRPDLICGKDLMAIGEAASTLLQAWTRVLSDLDLIMSISSIITKWILRHHLRRLWVHLKCPFVISQNRYSIFDRTIENNGLKDTAYELGKGIIAFSPLAQELLTKRYLNGIPADSRIATDGRFLNETALTSEKLSQIQALNEIAMERGQTLAEMALSWILKDDKVTSVLIGASKPEQILDNIKIIGHTDFSDEELKKIDDIVNS